MSRIGVNGVCKWGNAAVFSNGFYFLNTFHTGSGSCAWRKSEEKMEGLNVMNFKDLRKNLTKVYPFGGPERLDVEEGKVEWGKVWEEYNPPDFTTPGILKGDKPWADKELGTGGEVPKWNEVDGGVDRRSHHGKYELSGEGYPLNPVGRTGLKGRGNLGRWGPNHAADCLITRWKRDENGSVFEKQGKKVLQLIAVIRKDTGDFAFPGGMIDLGEDGFIAAKREFLEEVFSIEDAAEAERLQLEESLKEVFASGEAVYKGYVDDRRNTDNAWIETEAIHFSLPTDKDIFQNLKFKAGSDAKGALWIDLDKEVRLYASHKSIIEIVVQKLNAFW